LGTVVTVMNMKGGVGKTTVALHLSGALARNGWIGKGHRNVLVIDYDPQFNLTQALLPPRTYFGLEKARKTTLSILIDSDDDLDPYVLQVPGSHRPPKVADVIHTVYIAPNGGKLDLVPSTLNLMYVALGEATANPKPIVERFAKFITEARSMYDVILIDCHPAGSIFTQTSLKNSDHVLIPVMPQRYAVRGIGLMMDFIKAKEAGGKGPMPHILFNHVPRTGVARQELEIRNEKKFSNFCMKTTLKKYSAFTEPEGGAGFVWQSSKAYSTEALGNLLSVTREFANRIGV
jgi:chromosome partitioning protein